MLLLLQKKKFIIFQKLWDKKFINEPYLELAAKVGSLEIVEFLLHEGVDVNHRRRRGDTALSIAARKGNIELILLLLQYYPDLSIIYYPEEQIHGNQNFLNILSNTISSQLSKEQRSSRNMDQVKDTKYKEVLHALIEQKASLELMNSRSYLNNIPYMSHLLTWSVQYDHAIMEKILDQHSNLEEYKPEAIIAAISTQNLQIVEKLWDKDIDKNHLYIFSAIERFKQNAQNIDIKQDCLDIIKFLIENGADRFALPQVQPEHIITIITETSDISRMIYSVPLTEEKNLIRNIFIATRGLLRSVSRLGQDIIKHIITEMSYAIQGLVSANTIWSIMYCKYDSKDNNDIVTKRYLYSDESQSLSRETYIKQKYIESIEGKKNREIQGQLI